MAAGSSENNTDVIRFILDEIESVPHLEALLLIRTTRPQKWSAEALSKRLYVSKDAVQQVLDDLLRRNLITVDAQGPAYFYQAASEEKDLLISRVDQTYRHQLVRITQLIHSKPPAALRDFSRAFRFTKEE
jgi:predicted ArsR family transcriptional regulator